MTLTEALKSLSHLDDGHWTGDGLPSLRALSSLMGRNVLRGEVTAEAPELNRDTAKAAAEGSAQDAPETPQEPAPAAPEVPAQPEAPEAPLEAPEAPEQTGDGAPEAPADEPVIDEQPLDEAEGDPLPSEFPELTSEQELVLYDNALAEIDAELAKLQETRARVQKERDELVADIDQGNASTPLHVLVQQSFARQDEERAALHERQQALRALVGTNAAPSALSPLDAVMGRKNGYGLQRPAFSPEG